MNSTNLAVASCDKVFVTHHAVTHTLPAFPCRSTFKLRYSSSTRIKPLQLVTAAKINPIPLELATGNQFDTTPRPVVPLLPVMFS